MHERSILHRDLKTQNIFLTRYEIIKIGDLGIAKILDNNGADLATTVIGTPYVFKIIIEINTDCLLLDII
jgi:NIMA (never in mitosis gene a)-related kinase